jgi:hypothetical protein
VPQISYELWSCNDESDVEKALKHDTRALNNHQPPEILDVKETRSAHQSKNNTAAGAHKRQAGPQRRARHLASQKLGGHHGDPCAG